MRNTTSPDRPAGPSQDRLWTEDDLAVFLGFRSVSDLIGRHSDFPAPVPLLMHGRRWRPSDVVAWVNQLCDNPGATPSSEGNDIPALDLTAINELLEETLHATTR
jgi:predicted DNA-binding transcriptional regulator AlpA